MTVCNPSFLSASIGNQDLLFQMSKSQKSIFSIHWYSLVNLCISQISDMAISFQLTKALMFPFRSNLFFFFFFFFLIRHPMRCSTTWLSAFRIHFCWVIALPLYFLYLPSMPFSISITMNAGETPLQGTGCNQLPQGTIMAALYSLHYDSTQLDASCCLFQIIA